MKIRKIFVAALMISASTLAASAASQFNLGSLLGGLNQDNNQSQTTAQSGLGGLINGAVNAVTGLLTGNQGYEAIVGTWHYVSPAVSFKSDNFLQQAGGAAASGVLESKLEPYYLRAGINSLVITFNEDKTFEATVGRLNLQGTVEESEEGSYVFSFMALGSIPAGKLTAYFEQVGANISLTFDAKRMIAFVKTVASISRNSTINTVAQLLESYDGVNIGVKLSK